MEMNPCTSQPQTQSFSLKKTKPALKRFLYIYFLKKAPNFQETKAPKKIIVFWDTGILKKLLIFKRIEMFSPPQKYFLYFGK